MATKLILLAITCILAHLGVDFLGMHLSGDNKIFSILTLILTIVTFASAVVTGVLTCILPLG